MNEQIRKHYAKLAPQYNQFWSQALGLDDWLTSEIISRLDLHPDDILVDLGCGTGVFSHLLYERVGLRHPVWCVDPSSEMLDQLPTHAGLRCVQTDAHTFVSEPHHYTKVLMNRMLHHVENPERLLQRLYARLPAQGKVLVVVVPPYIAHPLFQQALGCIAKYRGHSEKIYQQLIAAGFQAERDEITHPVRLCKKHLFLMVRHRYLSTLNMFTDEEITVGLEELADQYADRDHILFTERLIMIRGLVTGNSATQ